MIPSGIVVFDLDGTLLRLEVDIDSARAKLGELFAPFGISRPFRPMLTRIHEAALEAATAGGDAEKLRRAGLEVLDAFEVEAGRRARSRLQAPDVVEKLLERGLRLGLVTDNGRACVAPALEAVGIPIQAFSAISTRDEVARAKPDPAGLLNVLRAIAGTGQSSFPPVGRSAWYVGDMPRDVETARAAGLEIPGIRAVSISGGLADKEALKQAGADAVIEELSELIELIDGVSPAG